VGHVDERDSHLLLDRLELDLHVLAQLEVEGAQRLVEQQHPGPVDERAGERDPLPLTAGELGGPAALEALETDHPERLPDAGPALALRDLPDHEPVRDVVADVHVGKQRVVLEHRVDVALERRPAGDVLAVQQDPAGGGQLEARDHPQRRRLARPRRAQHGEELAVGHVEVHAGDGDDLAESLLDRIEPHCRRRVLRGWRAARRRKRPAGIPRRRVGCGRNRQALLETAALARRLDRTASPGSR
jgi:hypothetical protein